MIRMESRRIEWGRKDTDRVRSLGQSRFDHVVEGLTTEGRRVGTKVVRGGTSLNTEVLR